MQHYSRQPDLLRLARKLGKLQVSGGERRADPVVPVAHRAEVRLSEEVREAIAQQYRDGIPTTALCREHGLGKSTVLKILRDAGVPMRRQPMTPEQVEKAQELYAAGLSLEQVGHELDVHPATVQRTLWRHGVTLRAPNGWEVRKRA